MAIFNSYVSLPEGIYGAMISSCLCRGWSESLRPRALYLSDRNMLKVGLNPSYKNDRVLDMSLGSCDVVSSVTECSDA